MKHLCIFLIRLYQRLLSPLKSRPTCRFTPTCSSYAIQAFEKRGFFVGLILTVFRIARCQPFCAGGYDPVPLRGLTNRYVPMPMTKYFYPEEYFGQDTEAACNDCCDTAQQPSKPAV